MNKYILELFSLLLLVIMVIIEPLYILYPSSCLLSYFRLFSAICLITCVSSLYLVYKHFKKKLQSSWHYCKLSTILEWVLLSPPKAHSHASSPLCNGINFKLLLSSILILIVKTLGLLLYFIIYIAMLILNYTYYFIINNSLIVFFIISLLLIYLILKKDNSYYNIGFFANVKYKISKKSFWLGAFFSIIFMIILRYSIITYTGVDPLWNPNILPIYCISSFVSRFFINTFFESFFNESDNINNIGFKQPNWDSFFIHSPLDKQDLKDFNPFFNVKFTDISLHSKGSLYKIIEILIKEDAINLANKNTPCTYIPREKLHPRYRIFLKNLVFKAYPHLDKKSNAWLDQGGIKLIEYLHYNAKLRYTRRIMPPLVNILLNKSYLVDAIEKHYFSNNTKVKHTLHHWNESIDSFQKDDLKQVLMQKFPERFQGNAMKTKYGGNRIQFSWDEIMSAIKNPNRLDNNKPSLVSKPLDDSINIPSLEGIDLEKILHVLEERKKGPVEKRDHIPAMRFNKPEKKFVRDIVHQINGNYSPWTSHNTHKLISIMKWIISTKDK